MSGSPVRSVSMTVPVRVPRLIATARQASTWGAIAEHLLIAIVVISYYVGDWIEARFTR